MSTIEQGVASHIANAKQEDAKSIFSSLIQTDNYVGDVYSINYEYANVLIHDFHRHEVGGIPSLSFLIATRIQPQKPEFNNINYQDEDSSVILLRVMDAASLPQDSEAERIRVETAENISGEVSKHWDDNSNMDFHTKNILGFAGVKCRIIGTFYLEEQTANVLQLKFGSDISNYYPNRGLKVYKPTGAALRQIVNYTDTPEKAQERVEIGYVRYASTNRKFQNVDNVPVSISPLDLLCQKTALFGMTRTGKSNTTKIIAKSVYELRKKNIRIGQLIFDPNGEYANENEQDNKNALKNVWTLISGQQKENEVVTYGITSHPKDPDRHFMLLNFYLDENLQTGKEIINNALSSSEANYIKSFVQVNFQRPEDYESNQSVRTRYDRKIAIYRAILTSAGYSVPDKYKNLNIKNLFGKEFVTAIKNELKDHPEYGSLVRLLESDSVSIHDFAEAIKYLREFFETKSYKDFNEKYIQKSSSGQPWAENDLRNLLDIFQFSGIKQVGRAKNQHSHKTNGDYADSIYNELLSGKLVIVDQSTGDPELNSSTARRLITKIFQANQGLFIKGEAIPEILVYLEEAHNLLPAGNDNNTQDIWVRTAKEGAKYHIGMVYATQEVSSIQKNILKNTANWFISHLNNADETKELCKYYDFADFEPSIRRAQDKGFIRVKTLSNLFVVPVQINKFELPKQ